MGCAAETGAPGNGHGHERARPGRARCTRGWIALVVLLGPVGSAEASCVGGRQVVEGSVADFVGRVVEVRRGLRRPEATVLVDRASRGPVEAGRRVKVIGTVPAAPGFPRELRVGARYRFLPQQGGEPFAVNECLARRVPGSVAPSGTADRIVVERRPRWLWPAVALAFLAGGLGGLALSRRRT